MPHAEQLQEAAVRRIAPAVLILRQTPHLLGSITEWRPYEKSLGEAWIKRVVP